MTTAAQLRKEFLQFFEGHGHRVIPSSSLLPQDDPTLLFTNAGMVPFKSVFMGLEEREYRRAATSQKCIRLSGKHNDLENVGHTARHNTFFEMLGNFSFGDYFKKEAIGLAWEFLTEKVGLDPSRLHATVFREDDEAEAIWRKTIGLPASQVSRRDEKDNFWSMGETGPCGPCSEIHFDRGTGSAEDEGDRFLEVWNLVFMQFERQADGTLKRLPKPSIDTGMGLERLAMVVEGVDSNYETSLLWPLIQLGQELTGKEYGALEQESVSLRILADHARAVTFLLADGLLPSNEWQGYVLRKVLRRALRHGHLLELGGPFFSRFTDGVIDLYKDAYKELIPLRGKIGRIVTSEELRFTKTLSKGLELVNGLLDSLDERGDKVIPGQEAFRLYDTYGFPLDLTVEAARDRGFTVDQSGFQRAMDHQKERARESWNAASKAAPVYRELAADLPQTEFLGDLHGLPGEPAEEIEARVLGILRDGKIRDRLETGQSGEIVLDRTPFYAEAGGQVADRGILRWQGGRAEVSDAQARIQGTTFHGVTLLEGSLLVGTACSPQIDGEWRKKVRLNHTATHLLHAALREVLGEHVKQKGSLVAPRRLRFDFTHFTQLDDEEIRRVEEITNSKILENLAVETNVMALDQAIEAGAMALFGEKYGQQVRVVKLGSFSTELCGGTHARRSGDIGLCKIVSEESVAAGVRRIEAVTGTEALAYAQQAQALLKNLSQTLSSSLKDLPQRAQSLLHQLKEQEKLVEELRQKLAAGSTAKQEVRRINGVELLCRTVEELGRSGMRNLADELKKELPDGGVILLVNRHANKVDLVVATAGEGGKKLDAAGIVRAAAKPLGGKGGGRRDFAQAGGKELSKLQEAIEAAATEIERQSQE